MRLDIYVNYRGNCEQAFRFYEQHLGGRVTGILRHGDRPNPNIPADWKEKVLHARIEIGGTVLMLVAFTFIDRIVAFVLAPARGMLPAGSHMVRLP